MMATELTGQARTSPAADPDAFAWRRFAPPLALVTKNWLHGLLTRLELGAVNRGILPIDAEYRGTASSILCVYRPREQSAGSHRKPGTSRVGDIIPSHPLAPPFFRQWPLVAAGLAAAMIGVSFAAAADQSGVDYKTARFERRLPAVRVTLPIVIDGQLDEAAWRDAPLATGFIQNEPHAGEPASERTDVRILYDDTYLYIGVFAEEPEPSRIIVNELRKDFDAATSDTFMVLIDTFHDGRNGYQFATNPLGAKHDVQNANDGREINASWDGIWDVKTRIAAEGWYAEMAIPFRTLKFPSAPTQTWGINFLRRIRHRNEDSHWAPLPRFYRINRVSLAGTLEGLQGLHPGKNVRVKPYVLGSRSDVGASSGSRRKLDGDAGVDVKYALATNVTWDSTINTDFSQVEADEQQINLTRFSLFFPEKREFFLENSGIFQFGSTGSTSSGGASATSGRQNGIQQDLVFFFSRRIGLSDAGQAIPILAGSRLTGRAGRFAVGAVSIQQRRQDALPATNFTALRLRRNVFASSDVGVMFLNKDAAGIRANRAIGADANFRFFQYLNINGHMARTFSPGRLLEPGGRAVAARAGVNWRDNRWDLRASYLTIGSRFNHEMGFVPRVGVDQINAYVGVFMRPRASSKVLREIAPHWELNAATRASGGLDSRYHDFHVLFTFQDSSTLTVGRNPSVEEFVSPFAISRQRGIVIPAGRYSYDESFLLFRMNPAARLSVNGRYSAGTFYNGDKHAYQLGGGARISARLNFSGSFSRNVIALPAGAFTTRLVTGRINVNFTTRMFLNALAQYNTEARQWSSNVRFNLIHRPLSDFFLVYNERRDSRTMDLIDRALVAKLTYLVAF